MSDFDDWRSRFLISINSDDITILFDECIAYIEQIAYFNQLCEPNSNKTESFLTDTIKTAIDTILKYEITSHNRQKLGEITNFLKKITVLLPFAFSNNKFHLFAILNQITESETEIYKSIKKTVGRCDNLNEIKKHIIEYEYMTIMLLKLQKDQNIKISHFSFFFQTFRKLEEHIIDAAQTSLIFGLHEPYQNFLDSLVSSDINKVESHDLEELYTNFCPFAATIDPNMFLNCIQRMTVLAFNFFSSSDFKYQKIGSTLFKIFMETKKDQQQEPICNLFFDTLKDFRHVSKILSHPVHPDIYPIISPLIEEFGLRKMISSTDISLMWKNVVNSDDKESNKLYDMILNILQNLDTSEVEDFFQTAPVFSKNVANSGNNNEKNPQGQNLELFTKLIVDFLTDQPKMSSIQIQAIFNKLFNSADEFIQLTSIQPDDFLDLKNIYLVGRRRTKNNNLTLEPIRTELIKVLHSRFNEKYTAFIVRLLTDIASSSSNVRNDFVVNDINTITRYITDSSISNEDDVQYSLYPLYTILINEFDEKISLKVLQAMIQSPSDALWDFLYQIIEKSQLENFDDDAIQILSNFILNNYNQIRVLFLDFLEIFIINLNFKNGFIEVPDWEDLSKFTVKKTPLLYEEDVLEKIILETQDDETLKRVIDICFHLYDNYPNADLVNTKLLALFKKYVEEAKESENIKQKMNVVTFLFEYCKKNERKKAVKAISHIKMFKKSDKDYTKGKITYIFKFPDNQVVKLKSDVAFTSHNLYMLIGPYLSTSTRNYYIQREGRNPISLTDILCTSRGMPNTFLVKEVAFANEEKEKVKKEEQKTENKNDSSDDDNDDDTNGQIEGAGFFKQYKPIPSEFFALHDITKTLFQYICHFETPKNEIDENQNKFDQLIYDFLMYLPTDDELFVLSTSHEKFFPEGILNYDFQSFMNNRYALQYIFQVLLIRLSCNKYIADYKDILQQILVRIITNDDDSLTLCSTMLNEIMRFIKLLHLNSSNFIILLLKMLSLTNISGNSDKSKLEDIDILQMLISDKSSKQVIDISSLLCDNFDLFNKVLASISNTIWTSFSKIIFKLENPVNLFRLIIHSLLECQEEEMSSQTNRYYTDIFMHFILKVSEDAKEQEDINNYIRIFMKIMRCNPTKKSIESFEKIVNKNSDLLASQDNDCSLTNIIKELINIVRRDSKPQIMDNIIELLIGFASINIKNKQQLTEFAEQISAYIIEYSKWNQSSEANEQNNSQYDDDDSDLVLSHKEKGLTNLSQTCYLNSALQQFYHIPAFRYFISIYNPSDYKDEDEIPIAPSLNLLFNQMEFSRKNYINPEEFVDIFSSKHSLFKPGEQQDAQEFIEYFLDDLKGEAHNLFEWKLLTKYNKLDDGQEISSKIETFVSIPLSVEIGSMEQSLREFFTPQKLTGDNLYQSTNGTKMEALVTQKIETAPLVLIFQLKRFAYDKNTGIRIKINKKFVILNEITIKKYMLNPDENNPYKYILNGIVVHSGNEEHGHYTSLIKENISSDNWLRYDDSEIKQIKTRQEFENLAYGDDNDDDNNKYGASGYLLFYIRENATVNVTVKDKGTSHEESKFILDHSFPVQISSQDESTIDDDNNRYLFNQCVLEKSTFMFMMKCSENIQLFKYFFGVFCHTKMFDKIKEIKAQLISSCSDQSNINSYLNLMNDYDKFKSLIIPVFSALSPDKMKDAALSILNVVFSSSNDAQLAGKCVQHFIQSLKLLNKKWNRVCDIGNFIITYLESNKTVERVKYASSNKWERMLLDYIFNVYDVKGNTQNIDISTIFDSLGMIISSPASSRVQDNVPHYFKLLSINDKVKNSDSDSCKDSYKDLIIECINRHIFTVKDISDDLGKDFDRISFILRRQLEKAKQNPSSFPSLFENLTTSQGFTTFEVINELDKSRELSNTLLKPNIRFIVHLLIIEPPLKPSDDLPAVSKLAGMMTKKLMTNLDDDELSMLFNEMKEVIPLLDQAYPPFFAVLRQLIDALDVPQSEKIPGLDDLIAKSAVSARGEDMDDVHVFFNPNMLADKATELIEKAINEGESDSVNNGIIISLEKCIEKPAIFARIASSPLWKKLIDKKSRSNNFTFMSKLGSVMIKMQGEIVDDEILKISVANAIVYILSLVVQSPDYNLAKFIPNLLILVEGTFKSAKELISIEGKSDKDFVVIEPDFKVILDFDSYMKNIDKILVYDKRNTDKESAMHNYSMYVLKLFGLAEEFASQIKISDSEKLKQIQTFVRNILSSKFSIEPNHVFNPNLDKEKDDYLFDVINFLYAIADRNGQFFNDMINYMKNHVDQENQSIMTLFKLKFDSKSLCEMPSEKCAKEILQLCGKVKKHRELFFQLLNDILLNSTNEQLKKEVVKLLFLENTQMTERTFAAGIRYDSNCAVKEKNFFESFLVCFTDNEFNEILENIINKYGLILLHPQQDKISEIMEALTRLAVLLLVKPNKKSDIIKLLAKDRDKYPSRTHDIIEMILDCKEE